MVKNPHAFTFHMDCFLSLFFVKKEKRTPFIIYWMVRETEKWSESLLRAFFSKAQQIPSKKVLLAKKGKKGKRERHETISSLRVFILVENVLSFYLLCKHYFHPLASKVKVATTIHVVPFSRLYVVTKLPSFFPFCFSSWKTLKRLCCCLKNFKRRMSSKSTTKRSTVLRVCTFQ